IGDGDRAGVLIIRFGDPTGAPPSTRRFLMLKSPPNLIGCGKQAPRVCGSPMTETTTPLSTTLRSSASRKNKCQKAKRWEDLCLAVGGRGCETAFPWGRFHGRALSKCASPTGLPLLLWRRGRGEEASSVSLCIAEE